MHLSGLKDESAETVRKLNQTQALLWFHGCPLAETQRLKVSVYVISAVPLKELTRDQWGLRRAEEGI